MLLYGADFDVSAWVGERLNTEFDERCKAIGIVRNNQLVAGIVYSNYRERLVSKKPVPHMIDMSIASVDKRWATKHNLKALFDYPFTQLGLERVQAHCSAENRGVMRFLEKLGFTREGVHLGAYVDGGPAASYGMLRDECKWVGGDRG